MIRHILMTVDVASSEWSYSLELSRALAAHGIRVSLSTSGGSVSKDQRREAARVQGLAVYDAGFTLDWGDGFPRNLAKAREWLLTLEERLKPDLIHMNGFKYGPLVFKAPVVVVAHTGADHLPFGTSSSDLLRYRVEVNTTLEFANVVVSPTLAMLDELKDNYSFSAATKVIPYFRRNTDYKPTSKQKFVYSARRHREAERIASAIESAAGALDWPVVEAPDVYKMINGDSGLSNLPAHASTVSAKEVEQMSKAAIYCLPSQSESSDISVLEGALSRCALVVGDVPNLRENWTNCALFVPQGDTELLIKNLQMLMVDQDMREDLANRSYMRALEFSPERCIDEYLDAYQMAASTRVRPLALPR